MELLLFYRHIAEGLEFNKDYIYSNDIKKHWNIKSIVELPNDLLEDTSGLAYVIDTTDETVKRIVTEDYNKRMLHNLANDIKNNITNYEALENKYRQFELVPTLLTEKVNIKTIAEQQLQQIYDIADGKITHGLMTGTVLDKLTQGLQNEYILIGARPSIGKSVLGMQIGINVAKQGKKVAFFSLEMEHKKLVERMMYNLAHVNASLAKNHQLSTDARNKLAIAASKIDKLNIDIFDEEHTVYDIVAKCKKGDYDLVVIDYLQEVTPHRNAERRIVVEEISSKLAKLPKKINAPVVAIASLSRPHEKNINKEPTMMDFKETSKLEFDADMAILIHREYEEGVYNNQAKIILAKNRNGIQAATMATFRGGVYKFE